VKTLRSYVNGSWQQAASDFATLVDPCSEEPIAQASSRGVDFAAALTYARERGGPALRERTLESRGELLLNVSRALQEHRDELISLSLTSTGTTRKDAKFDVDGGIFTLAHYGQLGQELGQRRFLVDGEGIRLGRSARYWGQHLLLPLTGVAVHVNAFNFPVWGWAEKAACAWLAGMPTITKPATSTALVTERVMEIVLERELLPEGSASLVCGSAGNLLDLLGEQDVLAFTGSAATAMRLRGKRNLLEASTRVNIEADSLNAAVLGPDVSPDDELWSSFLRDVEREITQKTGQKCTAVRRILLPAARIDELQSELADRLSRVVVGNPADGSVTMGPLATADQLLDTTAGVAELATEARLVLGEGKRIDGVGNPEGKGYFFPPTLLRLENPDKAKLVHEREVFGPVATVMPYDGSSAHAARLVARARGSLVTSIYSNDRGFLADYLEQGGATSGRLYVGSEKVAGQLPGSGVAMPQLLHGGPGRAGGGAELGGERGLTLYLQRVALSGDRALLERLAGASGGGAA
jgi:oxepin-CoA hydrolase/3-oxo-5,6-dehydrosuberyl-CoA semialdehyde dehydrogenase